jgi:Flp pilus assembly pilin Flp
MDDLQQEPFWSVGMLGCCENATPHQRLPRPSAFGSIRLRLDLLPGKAVTPLSGTACDSARSTETKPLSSLDRPQESCAMRFLKPLLNHQALLNHQEGATAVEYGILLGLIIVVSVGTLGQFGGSLLNIYNIIDAGLP